MTATATATATTPVVVATVSKKQLAGALYIEMHKQGKPRKDIIDAMMEKANLSFSGASTYYQNFKSGQWDPKPKQFVAVSTKPDPKIGQDFEAMTEDEVVDFFNEHNHGGVEVLGFLSREDAINLINAYC